MGVTLEISRSVLDEINGAAVADPTREICGILFGDGARIDAWQQARNVADDADHRFEIDPAALFAAIRSERDGGPRVAGYVHSHPSGSPEPSATDRAMAEPDGRYWLIVARGRVRAWRSDGPFIEVALIVTE